MVQQTGSLSPQKPVRRQSIRVLAKKAVGTPKQKSPKNVVGSARKNPKQKSFGASPFNDLKETVKKKTPLNKKQKKSKSPSVSNGFSGNTNSAEMKKSPKEPSSNSSTPGRTSVGNINKKHSFIETVSPGPQMRLLSSNSTPEMSVGGKKKKQSLSSSFSNLEKKTLREKPKKQSIISSLSNPEKSPKKPSSNSNTPGRTSVGNINKKHSFIETVSPGLQMGLLSSNRTPEMSVGGKKKKQSLSSSFSDLEKTPLRAKPKKQSIISSLSNPEKSPKEPSSNSNTPGRTSVGNINKKHSFIETVSPDLQMGLLSSNSAPEMSVGGKKKKQSLSNSFSGLEKTPLGEKRKKLSIISSPSNPEKSIGGQKKESFGGPWITPERTPFGRKSKKQSISENDSPSDIKESSVKSPLHIAKSTVVKTPLKGTVLEVEEAMDVETQSSVAARTTKSYELLSFKELECAAHIKFQHPANEGILLGDIRGLLRKNGITNVQTINISEPKRKNKLRFGVITFKDNHNLEKFLDPSIPLIYKGFEIGRTKFDFHVKAVVKPFKRPSEVPLQGSPPKKSMKSPPQVVPPKEIKKSDKLVVLQTNQAEVVSNKKKRQRPRSSNKKGQSFK